jgi:outer membrane receptor protein involved in Fe transport
VKRNLIHTLLLGTSVAAMASSAAFAQDQSSIETVVVTGSLIPRASMGDAVTPSVVIDDATIKATGYANIANVLVQTPSITYTSSTTNTNFQVAGAGVSNINQYSLGANRTLVLVNGRRWVTGSPTSTAVDLNTIPTELVSRVDVITGGSSAVYGSDAVAGVVNIILKDDFEGIQANAQYGKSVYGDAGDQYDSLLVGGNFLNGAGNIAVSMSYEDSKDVKSGNRDLTVTDAAHYPGAWPCWGTVGFCGFLGGSAYSSYAPAGKYSWSNPGDTSNEKGNNGVTYYNPDGSSFVTAVNGFDRNPDRLIEVPLIRKNVDEIGHLQLTPWLKAFFEGAFSETSSSSQIEPYPGASSDGLSKATSAGGTGILIPINNPFIPSTLLTTAPALSPGLWFYRRFGDLGDRTTSVDRTLARVAVGFEGDYGGLKDTLPFLKDWGWKLSYVYGETQESQTDGGYYNKINMQEALNTSYYGATAPTNGVGYAYSPGNTSQAAGYYTCADPIAQAAGCVPINLFGAGAISSAASKYVSALATIQDLATEQDVNLQTNGTVFDLPAGPLAVAVGGEYRRESAKFIPDSAAQAGTIAGNQVPATAGAYTVREAFGEVSIPILKDLPFVESLSADIAGRVSDYNTSGTSHSWNMSAAWQIVDDLKLRGNLSTAVRAPNIGELYTPNAQTFPGISSDLCQGYDNLSTTMSATVRANCTTQIAALSNPDSDPTSISYTGSSGLAAKQGVGGYTSGNPHLSPEVAHTVTGGFVFTPSFLPNFQATMDYYKVNVLGYIGSLSYQVTQQACYESTLPVASNIFCQQITRQYDPSLGPIIKQINQPLFNLGSIRTSGVDASMSYLLDLSTLDTGLDDAGSLAFNLDATYVGYYNVDPGLPGTTVIREGGDVGVQKWRGTLRTTYTNGPLATTLTFRYLGPAFVSRESIIHTPEDRIPSVWYTDLNVSYDFTSHIQGYFGAHNLFNVRPPETYIGVADTTGTGTNAAYYDAIGAYFYTGVTLKM